MRRCLLCDSCLFIFQSRMSIPRCIWISILLPSRTGVFFVAWAFSTLGSDMPNTLRGCLLAAVSLPLYVCSLNIPQTRHLRYQVVENTDAMWLSASRCQCDYIAQTAVRLSNNVWLLFLCQAIVTSSKNISTCCISLDETIFRLSNYLLLLVYKIGEPGLQVIISGTGPHSPRPWRRYGVSNAACEGSFMRQRLVVGMRPRGQGGLSDICDAAGAQH